MAHQTPLSLWALKNKDLLGTRFREFSWPARYGLGLFDFQVELNLPIGRAVGRGVDADRSLAVEKAVSEAIERLVCMDQKIDSIGLSVGMHFDPSNHALYELIERYALKRLLAGYSQIYRINDYGANRFNIPGAEVEFGWMDVGSALYGVVCLITRKLNLNVCSVGFGVSDRAEMAIQKAFHEAIPNFAHLVATGGDIGKERPWHLQPNFLHDIRIRFDKGCAARPTKNEIPPVQVNAVGAPNDLNQMGFSGKIVRATFAQDHSA